jgi:hypothetical protein
VINCFYPANGKFMGARAVISGVQIKKLPDLFEREPRCLGLLDKSQTP